jgi:hypothetical protein
MPIGEPEGTPVASSMRGQLSLMRDISRRHSITRRVPANVGNNGLSRVTLALGPKRQSEIVLNVKAEATGHHLCEWRTPRVRLGILNQVSAAHLIVWGPADSGTSLERQI